MFKIYLNNGSIMQKTITIHATGYLLHYSLVGSWCLILFQFGLLFTLLTGPFLASLFTVVPKLVVSINSGRMPNQNKQTCSIFYCKQFVFVSLCNISIYIKKYIFYEQISILFYYEHIFLIISTQISTKQFSQLLKYHFYRCISFYKH